MPFSTAQRLSQLSVPMPLAQELGRQIDANSYNVYRLIEMGMDSGLAKVVVTQPFDKVKATRLGMIPAVAALIASLGVSVVTTSFISGSLPTGWTYGTTGTDSNIQRLTRSSTSQYVAVSAGQPRFHHDDIGAPLGLALERSHSSKCVFGANPATAPVDTSGSWASTPVNVTRITGLGADVASYELVVLAALRQDNSASASPISFQIKAQVGTLNKHSIQALTRDAFGTGLTYGGVQLSGGGSVVGPPGPGQWFVASQENMTPSLTTRLAQIVSRANRALDIGWILLTETSYCPIPYLILVDNVTPTLANEFVSAPSTALPAWNNTEVSISFEWFHEWPFSVDNEPIFSVANPASPSTDYLRVVGMADGTVKADMAIGGVSTFSSTFTVPARRTVCRAAIRLKSGSFIAAVNGVAGSQSAVTASWAGLTTSYLNRLGTSYSNTLARFIRGTALPLSNDQIIAASHPNDEGFI